MNTHSTASQDLDLLLGRVATEFFERLSRGEAPQVDEYVQLHPEIAELIRHALPALQMVTDSLADASSIALSPGERHEKQLGDFHILHELGRGGMGIVYEAEQISMGRRKVALKVLPFAAMVDEKRLQRFRNEIRAAASLDHPNIVSVYSVGEERGVHFYAMQLIRGQNLAALIDQLRELRQQQNPLSGSSLKEVLSASFSSPPASGSTEPTEDHCAPKSNDSKLDAHVGPRRPSSETVPEAQGLIRTKGSPRRSEFFHSVAELGIQAAEALEHAHQQGVIHRDIKPANLMVDANAKLYITDFGLAQMEDDVGITLTGDIVGTLRYMSPEQALGKRVTIDLRADIYALGVSLYELLTTEPAFDGANRAALLKQIAFQELRRLRQIDRTIPLDLETIIHKAVTKNPDDRYSSAQEFANDLKAYRNSQPIAASPPSIVDRSRKWAFRNQGLVLATAVVMLLTTVGLAIGNFMIASQRDAAQTARDGEKRQREEAEKQTEMAKTISRFLTDYVLIKADPSQSASSGSQPFRDALDSASQYAEQRFPNNLQLKGALYQTIAKMYGRLGQFERSETHYRQAIELLKTSSGDGNSLIRLEATNELGHTLTLLGKTVESEQLLRRSLEEGATSFGNVAPVTLTAMLHLSEALAAQDKLEEARTLAQQCWNIRARVLGPSHLETAIAAIGLAHVLSAGGETAEAQQLLLPAANILREQRGIEDLGTQQALQDLAKIYVAIEDLPQAESILREILQTRIRVLGSDHSLTMAAMEEMVSVLETQGRFAEAESLLTALAQSQLRRFGSSQDVDRIVGKIAKILWKQGDVTKSERVIRLALSDHKGEPLSLDLAVQYADVLLALGKHAQAEQFMRESFERAKSELGVGHPHTADCLNHWLFSMQEQRKLWEAQMLGIKNLGTLLGNYSAANSSPEELAMTFILQRRPYEDTVWMMKDSLLHKRETLPKMHLSIATTLSVLAQNLMVNQNFAEAESFLQECLEIRQQGLPADSWLLAETNSLLGECLSRLNQFEKSQALLVKSYHAIADSSELVASHKVEFAERLATLYKLWGKPEESRFWHEEVVRLLSACLTQWKIVDPIFYAGFVMDRQDQLSESFRFLERFEEAEAILLPAAALQEIHRWYDDPFSIQGAVDGNRQSLADLYDAWNKPEEAKLWRALSTAASNCGEIELAAWYQHRIEAWESVCQRHSNSIYDVRLATAYSDLALLCIRYKNHDAALDWFEKSIELLERVRVDDPEDRGAEASLAATQLSKADALTALNRHADALRCLELAVKMAVTMPRDQGMSQSGLIGFIQQASTKLALFLANCPDAQFRDPRRSLQIANQSNNHGEDPMVRLALGLAHYRLNDFPSAIEVLSRASSSRGEKDFVLAMAHSKMGDGKMARFYYDKSLSNYESYRIGLKSRNQLGRWWDFDQIQQICTEANQVLGIHQGESDSFVAHWRGVAYMEQGLVEDALAAFRKSIDCDPNNCEPHLGLAKAILASEGEGFPSAVEAMKKYFELNPRNPTAHAYATLAKVAARNGDVDAAFDAAEKALQLVPDFAQAYHDLAQVLASLGLYDKASRAFAKSVEIKPNESQFLNNFAWFLANCENVMHRDPVRAVELATKLMQHESKNGDAWNTFGVAQFRNGDFRGSIRSLQKGIELNHEESGFDCIFLAMAHWKLGDHELARVYYAKADTWMKQHKKDAQELQRFLLEATESFKGGESL